MRRLFQFSSYTTSDSNSGHAALVESVYRMVYVMATLDRGRLIDAGRGKELEDIIAAAHRTMAETMDEGTG